MQDKTSRDGVVCSYNTNNDVTNGDWSSTSYFYDGWLLVKEVVANTNGTTDVIEYHWGKVLSGTRGGAAGVGGLLYLKRNGEIYVPWYDSRK